MRKHYLYYCFVAAVLLVLSACDNTDYSKRSPFDNSAYLNVAAINNVQSFTFNRKVTEQTKAFAAKLSYPVGHDVTVNFKIEPGLIMLSMIPTMKLYPPHFIACQVHQR